MDVIRTGLGIGCHCLVSECMQQTVIWVHFPLHDARGKIQGVLTERLVVDTGACGYVVDIEIVVRNSPGQKYVNAFHRHYLHRRNFPYKYRERKGNIDVIC